MSKEELKILESKRAALFSYVQTAHDDAIKLTGKDWAPINSFLAKAMASDSIYSAFMETVDKINSIQLAENPKFEINYQTVNAFLEIYGVVKYQYDYFSKIKMAVKTSKDKTGSDDLKMRKLELPTFNGELSEWQIFKDAVEESVINNVTLTDKKRMQYLAPCLKGKALKTIAGISCVGSNFNTIWQTLKDKYDDKRLVANQLLDTICNFEGIRKGTTENYETFLEKVNSSILSLENMNLTDLKDYVFYYLACVKLDKDTVKFYEMSLNGTFPSYADLIKFVHEQVKLISRKGSTQGGSGANGGSSGGSGSRSSRPLIGLTSNLAASGSCKVCRENHPTFKCPVILSKSPKERYNIIKGKRLCVNCFKGGHVAKDCTSGACTTCAKKHNSLLHFSVETCNEGNSSQVNQSVGLCSSFFEKQEKCVLLGTAVIQVVDSSGIQRSGRFLVDPGSQSSMVTLEGCEQLNLLFVSKTSRIKGLAEIETEVLGFSKLEFFSDYREDIFSVDVLIVKKIVEELPPHDVNSDSLSLFENLHLADKDFSRPGPIHGILGADVYPKLILPGKIGQDPTALETALGYIIMGPIKTSKDVEKDYCFINSVDNLDWDVQKFWMLEELPTSRILTAEEKKTDEFFSKTTFRLDNGRYVVSLPFKGNPMGLGSSFQTAKDRAKVLFNKLTINGNLEEYNKILKDYLVQGHMTLKNSVDKNSGYFLPHHAVIKTDSLTTKVRIVFDASAKASNGLSLNEILHKGPDLYANLFAVLLNFRLFAVALTGDIRQMYRQILVNPGDRKYQKILWKFEDSEEFNCYELNTVTFGLTCSPFLALRTVQQLCADERSDFEEAAQLVVNQTYMDDLAGSVPTVSEAIRRRAEVNALLERGGFQMVKWNSNSLEVLQSIPEELRVTRFTENNGDPLKILGLKWDSQKDSFMLDFDFELPATGTKKNILSVLAKMFDPLGFLGPVTLYLKIIIQELWVLKLGWDDIIPDNLRERWQVFVDEFEFLNRISVPRHLGVEEDKRLILIGCCDASEKGYGAVIYVKTEYSVNLVCAKSKVAPLKQISLPRLELCGAVLLAKLMKIVIEGLQDSVEKFDRIFYLTDSEIVLHWINNPPGRWQTFVANRVAQVQELSDEGNWFHVVGSENPADGLSRGLTPSQLSELWFNGGEWMRDSIENWPVRRIGRDETPEIIPEGRIISLQSTIEKEKPMFLKIAEKLSNYRNILKVIVFILRFGKKLPRREFVSCADLDEAERVLLKEIQSFYFADLIKALQKNKVVDKRFLKLNPFLENGLVRVGGRLNYSNLKYEIKHPILLPKCPVVETIVRYYHFNNRHCGPELLLAHLRLKFWIFDGRNLARKIFRACNSCFKVNPTLFEAKMSPLPASRVTEAKPFFHAGVDFAGPLEIVISHVRGIRRQKAYICLFVCFSTKAVHIELVSALSTEAFLAAFKRFLGRRGACKVMKSDNGKNFVGAKNHLSEVYEWWEKNGKTVREGLEEFRINWEFIPPYAPHWGGIWESHVKNVKSLLYRSVGDQLLSYEELYTVLVEIEACLNSRPLTHMSSDPSEGFLTPAHFLNLSPLKAFPEVDYEMKKISAVKRFELVNHIVQAFWKQWRMEYLVKLQQREKWLQSTGLQPSVNQIVLLADSSPPLQWPLGKITKLLPGKDGVIRSVEVLSNGKTVLRPVVKLAPLPTQ